MEIPFDYVVFYLMYSLETREKELRINKRNLLSIFESLIKLYPCDEKEKNDYIREFDFYYELKTFLEAYNYCIEEDGNDIVFESECEVAQGIVTILEEEIDEDIVEEINYIIDDNYIFLKLLGIDPNKKIYNFLLDNEKKIEEIYIKALSEGFNDSKRLRYLITKKIFTMSFINNNFNYNEYMDMSSYSSYMAKINSSEHIALPRLDENIDQNDFFNGPFFKALFYKGDIHYHCIAKFLKTNLQKLEEDEESALNDEKIFYTTLIRFLDEQMNNIDDMQIIYMLENSKNRLMYTIDSVYDTYSYDGFPKPDDSQKNYNSNRFSFVSNEIIVMIRDLLSCDDSKYFNNGKYNVDMYLLNIIRVVFIKTYYYLTNDKLLEDYICNNEFYKVNKISSEIIDTVISNKKIKIRKK